tara:strand:- start:8397 stop:9032 length:636 start_codon:yes stop_codon:yes gene_type:complete
MIYPKNSTIEIYSNANGLTDREFITQVYLSEIASLIRDQPRKVIAILRLARVELPPNPTRKQITNTLIDRLFDNPKLRTELSKLVASAQEGRKTPFKPTYSNDTGGEPANLSGSVNTLNQLVNSVGNVGEGAAAGASAGGPVTAVIGVLAGLTESIFDWKGAKLDAETQANKYKLEILEQIRAGEKPNYTPYIVLGSVLLVGVIVLIVALR